MSYHLAERNERQGRFHALVLAITLHLALAALLYLYTSEESVSNQQNNEPAKIENLRQSQPEA